MSGIEDWEPVPASNNAAPPVGAPENHDRTDVNNIAREMMASQRADWEGSATGGGEWRNLIKGETLNFVSGTVVDVVGVDVTAFFPAGRKIRVLHSSGSDAYCFVASSAFTTNTRITVSDFDSAGASAIASNVDRIQIHNAFGGGFGIRSGAFESAGGSLFEIPTALTAAGINAAITAASSAGKIVLLDDDTYNLEAAVVMQSGVSIWGRGMHDSSVLKVNYDGYAITSGLLVGSFTLRGFSIDGNSAARAAGGGISLGDQHFGVLIEDLFIEDVWEHGITTLSPLSGRLGAVIRNVEVSASGDNAFNLTDPRNLSTIGYYSGLTASNPGSVGKALASASGLRFEGEATLSDITVVGVPASGFGIRLEQVGVGAATLGGRKTVLNGFRIISLPGSSTGLFVGGRGNEISNGYVSATGASVKPLVVDGRGGSPEQALDNHISGVKFNDGLRCEIASDALRTEISDCTFDSQSSVGLAVSGTDTIVKGCTVIGGQATGIQVTGGSLNVEISGCTIRDTTADGINVQSGSNDCVISGCSIRDTGGDGIQIDAGADRARIISSAFDTTIVDGVVVGSDDVVISGCTFTGVLGDGVQVNAGADRTRITSNVFDTISGSDVSDGGTATVFRNNVPQSDTVFIEGVQQNSFGNALIALTGMEGIAFPSGGANGTRRYLIQAAAVIEVNITTSTVILALRIGAAGTVADAVDGSNTLTSAPSGFYPATVGDTIVTPASGNLATVSVDSTAIDDNIHANYSQSIATAASAVEDTYKTRKTFLHIRYLDG